MTLSLFVYGTLRRGQAAHARLCSGVLSVEVASVCGRLYLHPDGYPVLYVPPRDVRALGTRNAASDAGRARVPATARGPLGARALARIGRVDGDGWSRVSGQLLRLADAAGSLERIDAYEGFTPGHPSLFERVMLQVRSGGGGGQRAAWTYVAGARLSDPPARNLVPLDDGRWPARARHSGAD